MGHNMPIPPERVKRIGALAPSDENPGKKWTEEMDMERYGGDMIKTSNSDVPKVRGDQKQNDKQKD